MNRPVPWTAGASGRPSRVPGWARVIGRIVLLVLVVWGIFRVVGFDLGRLDWSEVAAWPPRWGPLAGSSVVLLAVYLAHALLWRRIAGHVTAVLPPVRTSLRVYFLANLGRYLPGKVWQIAGLAWLAARAGVPPVGATAAAVLGQVGFLATGALFLTALLPGWAGPVPVLFAAALLAAIAAALLLGSAPAVGRWLQRSGGRWGGVQALEAIGAAGRVRPKQAALLAAAYAATWVLLGAAFSLFAAAFVPGALSEARHLAGTVAAAYLGGYIAVFAPGGIGVREAIMSVLLAEVMPLSAAVTIAAGSRIWFTAVELLPLAVLVRREKHA